METRTRALLDLPSEILTKEVAKQANLDTGSVINLSLVNKYAYQLFKPTLLERLKKYIERSAIKQVEGLLKKYPNFATRDLFALCQSVLRQGDIDLLTVITKVRKDVLEQIELPEKLVDETNTYDFSAIVAAIESGQQVEEALAKMRTDLDKIVKEKGFPFQALLHAYEIYGKKHYSLPKVEQAKLFSIKVIGYLQRLSPAWLKKALATGLYNIAQEGKPCGDTFILPSGESIDPSKDVPNQGLGFDFCVSDETRLEGCVGYRDGGHLKNYLDQKQQSLVKLCSEDSEPKMDRVCVIV